MFLKYISAVIITKLFYTFSMPESRETDYFYFPFRPNPTNPETFFIKTENEVNPADFLEETYQGAFETSK